jgi:hypothetical protein
MEICKIYSTDLFDLWMLEGKHVVLFPIGFHAWLLGCLQFRKMGPVWRTPRMVTLPSDLARGVNLNGGVFKWIPKTMGFNTKMVVILDDLGGTSMT